MPEAGFALREIAPADHDALVALWIAAWAKTLPQIRFEEREPFIRERFRDWSVPPRRGRLVEQAGALIGFYLIDCATYDLEQICVAPDNWGQGGAEALLADARLLSPQRITLTVNRENPRALAFYRRQGFVETGESISPRSGLPLIHMEWFRR